MNAGSGGTPHRDSSSDIGVGPVLNARAARLRLVEGAGAAVAMVGLVAAALWLAGTGAPVGPSRTQPAGGTGAGVASPPASSTARAAATLPAGASVPITPAVPCNPRTAPPTLGITLVVDGGRSYAGSAPSNIPPTEVRVSSDARLVVILGAEDCAIAWDIIVTPEGVASPVFEDALPSANLSPANGRQNRWEVTPLPPGDYLLDAHAVTPAGQVVAGAWRLHVEEGGASAVFTAAVR